MHNAHAHTCHEMNWAKTQNKVSFTISKSETSKKA